MTDKYPQRNRDPWDECTYRTGATKPPKSHAGLIAFLLIAVIFLGGISSALSLLNIRLWQASKGEAPPTAPLSFVQSEPTAAAPTNGSVTVQLENSPVSKDNKPQNDGLSLQQIYTAAIDSVVSISCETENGSASGTGVILSRDGYVVTNSHVIEGAQAVSVRLTDQREFSAQLIGSDAFSDLAVLQIQATDLIPAQFGDSEVLRVGDAVVAIGDPLGVELRGTMTDGIVSAINRDVSTGGRTMTLIQTNAALNPGNSGGPLLNCYGQVIGINTMKIGGSVDSTGVEGLGFAIPSTTVKEVVDQLISQGFVSGRPSLGITGQIISRSISSLTGLPQGFYISQTVPGSAAAAAGVQTGDVLLSFDGVRITDSETLQTLLYAHAPGDTVSAVFYRDGEALITALTVGQSG